MQLNIKKNAMEKVSCRIFLDVNWLKKMVRKGTVLRYGKNFVPSVTFGFFARYEITIRYIFRGK